MAALVETPAPYRLRYSDWLEFPDDGRLYEIIDGELFVTPAPAVRHQRASRNLQYALETYARQTGGAEVFDAPIGVRVSDENVVEPDLVVVLDRNRANIGEQVIDTPVDVVVEVLSPGTAGRDLVAKRRLYAAAGIAEYWIVDTIAATIEVLELADGEYRSARTIGRDELLTSVTLPGFEVPAEHVFRVRG